jgi:hypothetical protein
MKVNAAGKIIKAKVPETLMDTRLLPNYKIEYCEDE